MNPIIILPTFKEPDENEAEVRLDDRYPFNDLNVSNDSSVFGGLQVSLKEEKEELAFQKTGSLRPVQRGKKKILNKKITTNIVKISSMRKQPRSRLLERDSTEEKLPPAVPVSQILIS